MRIVWDQKPRRRHASSLMALVELDELAYRREEPLVHR